MGFQIIAEQIDQFRLPIAAAIQNCHRQNGPLLVA